MLEKFSVPWKEEGARETFDFSPSRIGVRERTKGGVRVFFIIIYF